MGGLGHDFKAGVNFINEPHLFVTFSSGSTDYAYTHLTNDVNGPISRVTRNKPGASANLPMKQFGDVHPGRLARHRPADGQRRPALRPRHRLRHRSVADPELRRR